jgi:hypothetical protein
MNKPAQGHNLRRIEPAGKLGRLLCWPPAGLPASKKTRIPGKIHVFVFFKRFLSGN